MEKNGKVISIANKKGGCGKTTIATNLAVHFAKDGYDVLIVDADLGNHTAEKWSVRRRNLEEEHHVLECAIVSAAGMRGQVRAFRKRYDYIIVDGGANDPAPSKAACAVADFLIIPIKPSGFDSESTIEYLEDVASEQTVRDDLRAGLILNEVNDNTVLARELAAQIGDWEGIGLFENRIGDYEDFRKAATAGLGVVEINPKGKAGGCFQKFYQELRSALNDN